MISTEQIPCGVPGLRATASNLRMVSKGSQFWSAGTNSNFKAYPLISQACASTENVGFTVSWESGLPCIAVLNSPFCLARGVW